MEAQSLENATAAVCALLEHYHDAVVPAFGRSGSPDKQVVQVALLVRCPPLVEATLRLAEAGFGREAMILNRPLFELLLDASWAGAEPELADECFLAHARYTQHLQRQAAVRFPELGIEPEGPELSEDEVNAGARRFGRHAERSWTGLNTKRRVVSFEARLPAEERRQLSFVFEVLHEMNNGEIHPSSWSLARALRRVRSDTGEPRVQFRVGREPEFGAFALGFTWWVFLHQLYLMHEATASSTEGLRVVGDQGAELLGLR